MQATSSATGTQLPASDGSPPEAIGAVMKRAVPTDCVVDDDAKDFVYKCVKEFVSVVSCEASSKCMHDGRTKLNKADVCYALANMGYLNYSGALRGKVEGCSDGALLTSPKKRGKIG